MVEVIDFIIKSVEDVLCSRLDSSLQNKGEHILAPFTETGIFITRSRSSGVILAAQLPGKYQNEIHANEMSLFAYYAAINIEVAYHGTFISILARI